MSPRTTIHAQMAPVIRWNWADQAVSGRNGSAMPSGSGRRSGALNDNFNSLGFLTIGVFIAAWAGSVLIHRCKRLDDFEAGGGRA